MINARKLKNLIKVLKDSGVTQYKDKDISLVFAEAIPSIQQVDLTGGDNTTVPTVPMNQMPTPSQVLFWSADGGDANPSDTPPSPEQYAGARQ